MPPSTSPRAFRFHHCGDLLAQPLPPIPPKPPPRHLRPDLPCRHQHPNRHPIHSRSLPHRSFLLPSHLQNPSPPPLTTDLSTGSSDSTTTSGHSNLRGPLPLLPLDLPSTKPILPPQSTNTFNTTTLLPHAFPNGNHYPENGAMALDINAEKAHDGRLEKDVGDIKELLHLLKQFLDKELEKSYEEDERIRTLNGLQANCEFQTAHMSKIAESLKEDVNKQEELRTMTSREFQKTNETIVGLDEKLAESMNMLKAKGDELLNVQVALTDLHSEREAKEKLKSEIATTKEELAKTTELLKSANSELEIFEKENQEISARLSNSETMVKEYESRTKELDEDNSKLHLALEHSMKRINSMATDSENYVDRRIVAKLLLTYFQRNCSQEVLDLMMRLLSFSEEDKIKIGSALHAAGGRAGVHSILNITGRLVSGMLGSTSPELSPKEFCPSQEKISCPHVLLEPVYCRTMG